MNLTDNLAGTQAAEETGEIEDLRNHQRRNSASVFESAPAPCDGRPAALAVSIAPIFDPIPLAPCVKRAIPPRFGKWIWCQRLRRPWRLWRGRAFRLATGG